MSDQEDATDNYGNPVNGDRIIYCCFPDCGCDGERLCMAENGASECARGANVEGMYQRKDLYAQRAKLRLLDLVSKRKKEAAEPAPEKGSGE